MSNTGTRRAATLRTHINALAAELATCQTAAEVRCLKQAIRSAEFELTQLAVGS